MSERVPDVPPSARPPADRLDSWKEIATYLNRDVTTVQRWERREGMPVHRHLHDRMGSVYAFRTDLDAWARSRSPGVAPGGGNAVPAPDTPAPPQSAFALAVGATGPTKVEAAGLRRPGRLVRLAAVARAPQLAVVVAVAGVLASLLLASWLLRPRPTPQIDGATQLTFIGAVGAFSPIHDWFQSIASDGARIYFADLSKQSGPGLAYVSTAGGEVVSIPSPVESSLVLGLSPNGDSLLVRDWPSIAHMEGALWVVPTSGSAPKRLGDVMAQDAAWSPDGQSLLYARGEELYQARSDGGQARKLARTPGRAYWIRWSPDGRHLRFTLIDTASQRRSLWELAADGTNLHALPLQWDVRPQECCGEWSRDGRIYVFTAVDEQGADLWMLDESRSIFGDRRWKPRRLTSDSLRAVVAVPSVDGKKLYAVRSRLTPQVLRYDLGSRQLAASPFQRGLGVRFSRDRQWLAYVEVQGTRETLKRSRLDGSQALQLTPPPMRVYLPRWSPDGKRIAFSGKLPGKPEKAYVVSHEGGAPEQVLPGERNEVDVDWSPDGGSLMFGRLADAIGEAGLPKAIHIVDLKTKQVSTLPQSEGLFSPRWSPDGRHVVAMPLDGRKLMIFDFETAEWNDLAGPGIGVGFSDACRPLCNNPQWSMDGRSVYVQNLGTDVLRVALADRRVERVFEGADLGPTVKGFNFDGLTPDGALLLATFSLSSDIHALEWRVP
jgi:Tol biopolymer transport system component